MAERNERKREKGDKPEGCGILCLYPCLRDPSAPFSFFPALSCSIRLIWVCLPVGIVQDKANLLEGEFVLSAVQKERYEKSPAFGDASKQSQFLRRQENRWGKPHPTTARQRRAHCVSRYNSDFEMGDERGSDVILCAHCVSVVKNSRKGRRLLDRIMQNKANLVKGEVVLTAVQTERYGTFPAFGARQNKPNLPAGVAVCAAGGAMCEVSSARSEGSSSEPSDFRLHTPSETPYGVTTSGGGA